jgi:hypothetical protein
VTLTSTVAAAWLGAIAVIEVLELTVNEAGMEPNRTELAPVKLVPLMVTDVPPPVLPEVVLKLLTAGAEAAE